MAGFYDLLAEAGLRSDQFDAVEPGKVFTVATEAHPLDKRYSADSTLAQIAQMRREDARRLSKQRRAIRQATAPRTRAPRLRLVGSGGRPREHRAAATRSSAKSGDSPGGDGPEPPAPDEWPADLRPFTFTAFEGLISRRIPAQVRSDLFHALPADVQGEAWNDLRDDAEAGR